jgi:hypothetical protein
MIYTFNRDFSPISNYFDSVDRDLISWADDIGSVLVLHRLKVPKEWTKRFQNRYMYKDILDINPLKIKEDYIILLHPPKNIHNLWTLLEMNPILLDKNWILIGVKDNNYQKSVEFFKEGLSITKIDNLSKFLENEKKMIIRDKKLDQILNI